MGKNKEEKMQISPMDSGFQKIGASPATQYTNIQRSLEALEESPPEKKDGAEISDDVNDAEGGRNISALLNGLNGQEDVDENEEQKKAEEDKKAEEAEEAEEAQKAEQDKLFEELKALEQKIADTMKQYGDALKAGDNQQADTLLGQFYDLMKQREAILGKLGLSGLDTGEAASPVEGGATTPYQPSEGYTPIYSGGRGPDNGYFDGHPQTQGENFESPAPAPGPIPEGKVVPDGSGQDAVNLGMQYLGQNAIDIKGKLPNFTAAGGQTNNCADFVSSLLESTGRIKGHHINVVELEKSLLSQGYHEVPKDQAQPGDVWINDSRGHTEMVAEKGGKRLIGSNNDRPGHQVISLNSKSGGHYYHLDSKK